MNPSEKYEIPTTYTPRSRDEILKQVGFAIMRSGDVTIAVENFHESQMGVNYSLLEIALDCRDLLAEIALGMSEMRMNTEVVAVRAEHLLPEMVRAEPPVVEVVETTFVAIVNDRLKEGWTFFGAGVDPHGVVHYSLGKRAAA